MKPISKNEILNSYIIGKRVAYVGPSPYLVDGGQGSLIDSYDMICRLNNFTPHNYMNDYGSRTDILFHVFNNISLEIDFFRRQVRDNPKLYEELQLIIGCWDTSACFGTHIGELYKKYIDGQGVGEKPFTCLGLDNYNNIREDFNLDVCSGIMSLSMLLQCEFEELFITGFSFYEEIYKGESVYYPNRESKTDIILKPGQVHNQEKAKEYYRNTLSENKDKDTGHISVDDHMMGILGLQK